jgi:uncharacterized NAD(P)/FAD-binding protein YdhS
VAWRVRAAARRGAAARSAAGGPVKFLEAPPIAIVGTGASAVAVAAALAARRRRSVLLGPDAEPGVGAAYDADPVCLLNVPAARMSAEPDADAFVRWCVEVGLPAGAEAYVPRAHYARYLAHVLRGLLDARATRIVPSFVRSLTPTTPGWTVDHDGGSLFGSAVVLALGNPPPEAPGPLRALPPELRVEEPWRPDRLAFIEQEDPVLVVGTGLTFLDVMAVLARHGHRGPVTAVSRHGLLPLRHGEPVEPVVPRLPSSPDTLSVLRALRTAAEGANDLGAPWTAVMDGFRPHAADVWRALPVAERQRFLRHARTLWDVHRHRAPADVLGVAERAAARGRLEVLAGRIVSAEVEEPGVVLRIRRRNGGEVIRRGVVVVVATGPGDLLRAPNTELLRGLLEHKQARRDPLGLGIDTDVDGSVLRPSGNRSPTLFAIGPMQRPSGWDTTAIPDIRQTAARIAQLVARAP